MWKRNFLTSFAEAVLWCRIEPETEMKRKTNCFRCNNAMFALCADADSEIRFYCYGKVTKRHLQLLFLD